MERHTDTVDTGLGQIDQQNAQDTNFDGSAKEKDCEVGGQQLQLEGPIASPRKEMTRLGDTPFNPNLMRKSVKDTFDVYHLKVRGDATRIEDAYHRQVFGKLDSLVRKHKLQGQTNAKELLEEGDTWEARPFAHQGSWSNYPRTFDDAKTLGLERRRLMQWKILEADKKRGFKGANAGDVGAHDDREKRKQERRRIEAWQGREEPSDENEDGDEDAYSTVG